MIHFFETVSKDLNSWWGFPALLLLLGIFEFSLGLYENRWTKNERILDILSFVFPPLILGPVLAYFGLKFLPHVIPQYKGIFSWVPFFWGFLIIAIADDLTQYWYHRLHHQIPFLWRFHRTHHSAPYMGMAMASRQNVIYTFFFSQIYLTIILIYLGLGYPALSTPATHHAHHSSSTNDGVGFYKGNFGNMFFLWDVIFGTAHFSRQYPKNYGISHYESDEWYAQLLWPIFKSKKEGSELAKRGPVVKEDILEPEFETGPARILSDEPIFNNI